MQFAQLIINNFKIIDVIELRGLEETVIIQKEPLIQINAKNWSPIAWALGTAKMDYLNLFYTSMQPHLQHALDINPLKSLYQAEDSGQYHGKLQDHDSLNLNKGKCQALCLAI